MRQGRDYERQGCDHDATKCAKDAPICAKHAARRYWGILSVAIQRAGADSILEDPPPPDFTSLPLPSLETLLTGIDAPFGVDAPDVSRLPPPLSA